ncbi:MAG: asparaginase [Clostridia bacterium]|nr:asparaginase [Clostridia bacterium]
MKKILMIGTGGTIASEMTESGLSPKLDTEQLLHYIPDVRKICAVDCVQVMNLDSTNMTPQDWLTIARCIRGHYDAYDGFVISHGTDTMAYTAAALSYLIQGSPKPIVLTGAQKPISMDVTDSKTNLRDAFVYACSPWASGVCIVFNGSVILGTRAKKVRTHSFSAFSSINFPELAVLQEGMVLPYIQLPHGDAPIFYDCIHDNIGLVKLIPGADAGMLDYAIARYDAVIVESFGVGGLPETPDSRFFASMERARAMGKLIVMTTQVLSEGSDLNVYRVGHSLKKQGILEAFDMTTEAVFGKLAWILGQTRDPAEIARLFYLPIAHDLLITGKER